MEESNNIGVYTASFLDASTHSGEPVVLCLRPDGIV